MRCFQVEHGKPEVNASQCSEADIDEVLAQLEQFKRKLSTPGEIPKSDVEQSERRGLAQDILRLRRKRDKIFGGNLFGDPAWDILLELYAAEADGKKLSVSGACYASAVPPTTALRWIIRLERDSLVRRIDDTSDKRRSWLTLTEFGSEKMRKFLEGAVTALA